MNDEAQFSAAPWRQTGKSTWVARNEDGYVLRVAGYGHKFKWSLRPPGGGYDVSLGVSDSFEEAKLAVGDAMEQLSQEIRRSFDAG
jgi:hypothetical protein